MGYDMIDACALVRSLAGEWKDCKRCPLWRNRHSVVFGWGNYENPTILIIGEAPGPEEDARGLPFIGSTGRLLRANLRKAGIDDNKDCFITNCVSCFPTVSGTDFRAPTGEEMLACSPRVESLIKAFASTLKVILLVGKRAAGAILMHDKLADGSLRTEADWNKVRMNKLLGWAPVDHLPQWPTGVKAYVTFHPSYISRQGSNIMSSLFVNWTLDLKAVAAWALRGEEYSPRL